MTAINMGQKPAEITKFEGKWQSENSAISIIKLLL